jgi:thioredoxin reductase
VDYDVIIVGAGPAGLSAALILGRCRRKVLVLDTGRPRNAAARAMHGFLSRDGINPAELLRVARQQLTPYRSIKFARQEATAACAVEDGFEVTVAGGKRLRCRKLLLATGVVDEVPPVQGIDAFYGRSVFHCPYCDGWESRDQPLAVYSRTANGAGLALELTVWSKDIVLCTDGARLDAKHVERLERHNIRWRRDPIARLEGTRRQLRRIVFDNGDSLERRVMFFSMGQRQSSTLAHQLGCSFTQKGAVRTGEYEVTDIHGVYVAGDASRLVQLAIVAAAEGAQAAFAINKALTREALAR